MLRVQYLGYRFDPGRNAEGPARPAARVKSPILRWPPHAIARAPASIYAKLLAAFLAIAGLLIVVERGGHRRAARRSTKPPRTWSRSSARSRRTARLQHDTTAQLYSVASALLVARRARAGGDAAPAQPVRLRPRPAAVRRPGRDRDRRARAQGLRSVHRHRHGSHRADPRRQDRAGAQCADRARGPARRPARAAHQRAGQQGRGRHAGAHRREPGQLPAARSCW